MTHDGGSLTVTQDQRGDPAKWPAAEQSKQPFELSVAQSERAARLHRDALVVDSQSIFETTPLVTPRMLRRRRDHADLSLAAADEWLSDVDAADEALRLGEYDEYWQWHHDAGVDVVSVTLGAPALADKAYHTALQDCARWTWRFDTFPQFLKVTCLKDAREAHRSGRRGVILNFQDSLHLDGRLENLELFHRFGVRVMGLAYNKRTLIADGCTERNAAGLSYLGVEAVERMNSAGILVDASHASDQATLDAVAHSSVPIAVTHSACKTVHFHDRGKSDEVLAAIGETKGYFGIVAVPPFITDAAQPRLEHLLDHVDHAVAVAGMDCVGIGTDASAGGYTSDVTLPEIESDPANGEEYRSRSIEHAKKVGFRDEHLRNIFARLHGMTWWREWPNITRGLVARGYSDHEIRGILGENWLRVFEGAVG
jgi:membrane dipeptidase